MRNYLLSAPDSRLHGFIAQLSVLTQAIMQLIGYQVGNENMYEQKKPQLLSQILFLSFKCPTCAASLYRLYLMHCK